jgi:hypothetical protein
LLKQRGKYTLDDVKKLIVEYRNGNNSSLWFAARTRSLDAVINVFMCNEKDAEKIILDGIFRLQNSDFCRSNLQWGLVMDEYGLESYLGHNWYIKFYISKEDGLEALEEVSFHPLEKDMHLTDGRILVKS